MVNFDEVFSVLAKGVFAGIGLNASQMVGGVFARQEDQADLAGAAGNVAVGAAIDIFDDKVGADIDVMGVRATEYFGVGVQAAGWDEVGDVFDISLGSLGSGTEVIEVTEEVVPTDGGQVAQSQVEQEPEEEFLADVG